MEREFATPSFCKKATDTCNLFIGTISDPADFFLYGRHIGRVGSPPPQAAYSETYPVNMFLPPELLRTAANTLRIVLHTQSWEMHGITRGPLVILSSGAAQLASEMVTAGTVFLPLFVGFGLVILAVLTRLSTSEGERRPELLVFLTYCVLAAILMLGYSRLPREHFPQPLACATHFAMRFVVEIALLWLGAVPLNFSRKPAVRALCLIYACASIACLSTLALGSTGHTAVHVVFRWAGILFPTTAAVSLFYAWRHHERSALRVLFVCLLPMQTWDMLAARGFLPEIYFGRLYPYLLPLRPRFRAARLVSKSTSQ